MAIHTILLVEPDNTDSLYPFSLLHMAWEVRCGALRIVDRIEHLFPDASLLFHGREAHLRSFLARSARSNTTTEPLRNILILRGNLLLTADSAAALQNNCTNTPVLFTVGGEHVGVFLPEVPAPAALANLAALLTTPPAGIQSVELQAVCIHYLWDALTHNARTLTNDARFFSASTSPHAPGVFLVKDSAVLAGTNVRIGACSVLDASEGPIILGDNVHIMPHSTILGPCSIGDNSLIKVGAKIYGETSIGEWCKVGGEVENSIIHAYSNKQHDGFLGHSYLGEWVNLGADTNTSDLKNNYGSIRVRLGDREFNSERMFLGLLCGDHTKSGINTMLNTGTVTGISANIFGGDFPPKFIPSFSWGGRAESPVFELDKALALARTVMARRKRVLLPEEENLLRLEFERVS